MRAFDLPPSNVTAMNESLALFTSYRRALYKRYEFMTARYSELPNDGRESDGFQYTSEAKDVFPRYNVIKAVLDSIEELDGDQLPDRRALREELEMRTALGESLFTEGTHDDAITRTQADERLALRRLLDSIDPNDQAEIAPLPYRRVLSAGEIEYWYEQLRTTWGVQQKTWHPIISRDVPPSVLVVDADAVWTLADTRPGFVASWLANIAEPRIYELREWGPSVSTDATEFVPTYNGAEGFWFDSSLAWIAYASHEGSVALDGTIRAAVESLWPESLDFPWQAFRQSRAARPFAGEPLA
jgi:hypothetical protein